MVDSRIYFGRPGALAAIYSPKGSFEATRERLVSQFQLGNGGYAVDQMVGGSRVYTINYGSLTRDAYATLQGFAEGHEGPGPFVLLDPGQRNMLTANQSGATSVTNDTWNFSIAGSGCTIASSSAYTDAGPRVLAWSFSNSSPGASGAAYLGMDWPSSTFPYGIPVASRSHVFSFWVRGGGTDGVAVVNAQILWRDSAGSVVSTVNNSGTTTSGSWTQVTVAGTPPATGIYADLRVGHVSGASAGTILYLRRFMFEEGDSVGSWYPGTGVWPVRITSLADAWPYLSPELRAGPVLTLREDTS